MIFKESLRVVPNIALAAYLRKIFYINSTVNTEYMSLLKSLLFSRLSSLTITYFWHLNACAKALLLKDNFSAKDRLHDVIKKVVSTHQ